MESVIANRAGRAHRFFDIAGFYNMLHPVGITSPNAGEKICLQLEADREPIVFSFADPATRFTEVTATSGHLGTFPARALLALLLAHAGRLQKFGA